MEENNELSLSITTNHIITTKMIDDLMVCAFEGGINYWCRKVEIIEFPPDTKDQTRMVASEVLANNGIVRLYDAESSDKWVLNRMMVIKGISMYCKENNMTPDEMYDSHDVDTVDCIVQYALFDSIVFC